MKNTAFRAVQYLKYKKMKSIILILLFCVMSSITLFSMNVESTINNYYKNIDTTNGIKVTAQAQKDKASREKPTSTTLTTSQLAQIKELSYVSDIIQSKTIFVTSAKTTSLTSSTSTTSDSSTNSDRPGGMNTESMSGLKISANSNISLNNDFVNKNAVLKSGVLASKDNEIVISQALASQNNYKLNSVINLKSSDSSVNKDYTVVGIYEYDSSNANDMMAQLLPENTMYTTYTGGSSLSVDTSNNPFSMESIQYCLNSVDDLDHFKTDYYKISNQNSSKVELSLDDETYQSTIKPLMQFSQAINNIALVIIVISSIVIATITYLMIKERNYEIGVLYSLSESKKNIALQIILENMILLLIAFVISVILNFIFCSSLINSLMSMDLFNSVNEGMRMMSRNNTENLSNVKASFSVLVMLKSFIYMALVISIVSSLAIAQTLLKRVKEIINS